MLQKREKRKNLQFLYASFYFVIYHHKNRRDIQKLGMCTSVSKFLVNFFACLLHLTKERIKRFDELR